MKKVLYTATVLSHICQFHLPYLKELQDEGYEVHVAARNNLAEKNGLELKYCDKLIELPFQRSPKSLDNFKACKMLKKHLKEEYYDLIVCNTPMGGIVTRLAAKKTRKLGTKVIYIAHGFHFYKGASKKNWLIYYPIEKHFAKRCDTVVTINEEDYLLAKSKFKTNVERVHGLGVDSNRYYPSTKESKLQARLEMGYKEDDFLILVVGELLPNKNQMQAIQAVEKLIPNHPNVKLLIAGNGKDKEKLENYVKENNLENNIIFLGYCTNLEEYQRIVDLGVSCSKREGMPFNVIETMLSKNPFIATKNRGHNELIQDGVNGYLINYGDIDTLVSKINLLIKDEELRKKIAENAFNSIEPYCLNKTKQELIEILKKIIN